MLLFSTALGEERKWAFSSWEKKKKPRVQISGRDAGPSQDWRTSYKKKEIIGSQSYNIVNKHLPCLGLTQVQ